LHRYGGEWDGAEINVKGAGKIPPSGVGVNFGGDGCKKVAPVGCAMGFREWASTGVGTWRDRSERVAQGFADGGVECARVVVGCGFDPKDVICSLKCPNEIGVGCRRQFRKHVA